MAEGITQDQLATGVVNCFQASVTLTDAQIKTLPTAQVEIVAAQAGKVLMPIMTYITLDTTAGAYTAPADASFIIGVADSAVTAPAIAQPYLGQTGTKTWLVGSGTYFDDALASGAFTGSTIAYAQEASAYVNQNINISDMFTGHITNYTGGNAANSLKVTVLYTIVDV